MEQKLVTIVVPIYKVEKYLERCLRSIVNQSYRNLEIILVDDGSPDCCPEMCDEWAQKDARIKVFHKQNAGLGMARNTGIEHATGDYICFFDSDDYVDSKLVERVYERIEDEMADIALFGLTDVTEKEKVIKEWVPRAEREVFRGKEVQDVLLPDLIDCGCIRAKNKQLALSACVCMFSAKIIHKYKWRFVSERDIISEDSYSLIELYKHAKCVVIVQEALYFYRKNKASLTQEYREDRFERCKHFYINTAAMARKQGYGDEVQRRIAGLFVSFVIGAMKQLVVSGQPWRIKRKEMKLIVGDEQLWKALHCMGLHYTSGAKGLICCVMRHKKVFATWCLVYCKVIQEARGC